MGVARREDQRLRQIVGKTLGCEFAEDYIFLERLWIVEAAADGDLLRGDGRQRVANILFAREQADAAVAHGDPVLGRPCEAPSDDVRVQCVDEEREAVDRHAGSDDTPAYAVDDLACAGARPCAIDHPVDQLVDGGVVDHPRS